MKEAMKRVIFTLGLPVLFFPLMAGATRKAEPSAAAHAMVEHALAASDIEADDVPPARLHAVFRIHYGPGKFEDGQLLRIWTPSDWWHEEETMPGFESVEVSDGKQDWIAGNLHYVPYPVFLLRRALALPRSLRAATSAGLTAPVTSADGATRCVRTEDESERFEYCFETRQGNLVRMFDGRWNVTYQYSDYQPFAGKSFPRTIEVLRTSGAPFLKIYIDRLVPEKDPDLRIFLPVKGSTEIDAPHRCLAIRQAKLEKKVLPEYPHSADLAGITGVVRLYADIGTDGIPRGLWPINAVPPVLARAAIEAVRQWRYRPQICKTSGKPIPVNTLVTVLFVTR